MHLAKILKLKSQSLQSFPVKFQPDSTDNFFCCNIKNQSTQPLIPLIITTVVVKDCPSFYDHVIFPKVHKTILIEKVVLTASLLKIEINDYTK